jgi:hypothetical protein
MLPRQFNDGRDVPPEWIALAVLEIGDHFGSVSYETQIIEGRWQQAGAVYRDNLARILVDVPDRKKPHLDEGVQATMERETRTARDLDDQLSDRH